MSSPFGRPLKILIDTGASTSFINPEFVNPNDCQTREPITIMTILTKHSLDKEIDLPLFKEFKEEGEMKLLLFKFHNYFDGLLGVDILCRLKAKVDLGNGTLVTTKAILPLQFKPNLTSGKLVIQAFTKNVARIPVDTRNGDFSIPKTFLEPDLFISEGIYVSREWYSFVIITNNSGQDKTICIEQPIRTTPYDGHDFMEVNNFNISPNTPALTDKISDLIRTDHLNNEEKKSLLHLCRTYEDIFFKEGDILTFSNQNKHRIKTNDDIPIYTKSYRYPYVHRVEVRRQIDKMLEQGIIRPSFSPWNAPIWIVPKKKDASGIRKWRLVVDYRKLNEKTICDKYPIPNITEILDKLGKSMYFSTLDLASGFHQIEMHPKDVEKTAFSVDNGHFEFVRMPFGLKNAPSTFQRVMDNVLGDLIGTVCLVYLDDIVVYSTSLQEHTLNLGKVFTRLRDSNLKVQLDKSEFLHKECAFLGHIISPEGIKPNPEKIHAIKNFPIPKTQKEIKSFLGLLGYYRKFIQDFSRITKPFTQCLKKGSKIVINDKYMNTFETCKSLLVNDPLLQYPDFSKPFNLTTDASDFALGAILSQGPIGTDKPICYASRTLTSTEVNYSTIEKELLAIVWATKYFRPYIFGHKFKIITDHKPLTWIMSLKEPNSKLVRWRLRLEEFDYEVIYKKGKLNTNADALSRIKINDTGQTIPTEVNINTLDNISNHGTAGTTVHSANENFDDGIPISERPLNDFNIQIILQKSNIGSPMTLEIIFRNKQRRTIRRQEFNESTVTDILKQYLVPNKLSAIMSDDDTFKVVQNTYSKYFAHNRLFKLIRCKIFLKDIRTNDDQDKLINDYHNNNNHRGIQETLLHLKRDYYFPYMKNKITQCINHCNICQTLKYDRNPPKPNFEKPETPIKPLDIVHMDVYCINKRNILTIIDKFSKFASAYSLESRNSISILKSLKHYLSLHGIPKKLVCDQGAEFSANILKDFFRSKNIDIHYTSFQQSTSNSPVERLHSTMTEAYRIIYQKYKDSRLPLDHDEILFEVILTYNNSIHSATKLTPFELFYGRTPQFEENLTYNTEHEYLQKLDDFRNHLYGTIKEKLTNDTQKRIEKLNRNREDPETLTENKSIYRKECRRNKMTPRFSKRIVNKDNKVTLITSNNQKLHKSKIKRKHKT